MKKRLDIVCVELGLFSSRQKAQASIMAGEVLVNNQKICDSSYFVKTEDKIEILKPNCPYVSRGGLKLKAAIDYFKIDVKDKICLDIGAATGGFTDCFLQEGAKKVYCVDVGKGQLDSKIRENKRVVFLPNTNARYLKKELFQDKIQICAVDVSFISLKLILKPLLESIGENCEIILLIKPQFELERKYLRKGIVKSEEYRKRVIEEMKNFIIKNFTNCKIEGYIDCPIKGAKGNVEFLMKLSC